MTKTRVGKNAFAGKGQHDDLKKPKVTGAEPLADSVTEKKERQSFTVQIDRGVLEKARDAVYHTPGLTLAGLVEDALAEALRKMEKHGEIAKRPGNIRVGRPVR